MPELRVRELVQAPSSRHAEVAPHVLVAAEVQLLDCPRAWLKTLEPRQTEKKRERETKVVTSSTSCLSGDLVLGNPGKADHKQKFRVISSQTTPAMAVGGSISGRGIDSQHPQQRWACLSANLSVGVSICRRVCESVQVSTWLGR